MKDRCSVSGNRNEISNRKEEQTMKKRAPASLDSATFRQLWEALGSKLIQSAREQSLYTQGVIGSSPLPPTIFRS